MSKKLSRNEKIGRWTLGVTVIGIVIAEAVSILLPEIRRTVHLDKSQAPTVAASNPVAQKPPADSPPVASSNPVNNPKKVESKTPVAGRKHSEHGGVEILDAEGTVGKFSAQHTTITGQPNPGTSVKLFHVPKGGKVGTIDLGDTKVDLVPVTPIPPPPTNVPANPLSYKRRTEMLLDRVRSWLAQEDNEQPPDAKMDDSDSEKHAAVVRIRDFWAAATPDYNQQFASDISLLSSQLRKCDGIHNQVRDIHWRLSFPAQSHGSVSATMMDLNFIADWLPEDDSQLSCADGKD